ncbi:MAG: hypothetical protein GQ527_10250 [Bacteroidales bacterium]|nr:hypothetical protein [Bacteroidales bacterium]
MHYRILFLIFLLISGKLLAIHEPKNIGARAIGMGNIGVVGIGFNSVYNNQAALAYLQNTSIGIDYHQGFFADHALGTKSAAFILPTGAGSFGLSMTYFGYSEYNEQKIGLAYGKALGKHLAIGVQLDYFRTYIGSDYGNAHALSFEIGIYSKLSESSELGAHIFNPIGMEIGDINREAIAIGFQFGLLYRIDDQLLLATEVEKILDQKTSYKFGLEYHIIDHFIVRTGVATSPTLFTFGFGLKMKRLLVDIGTGFHQTLGFTPRVSLIFNLK